MNTGKRIVRIYQNKNMKRFVLLFICVIAGISLLQAQKLNVASFNIRYANSGDSLAGNGWQQRFPAICNLVSFHDFDIWGAQEVLNPQLVDLTNGLPQYGYIGVGRDDGKQAGEYAPIFYKNEIFDLLASGHFWLAPETNYPNVGWDAALPRICTWGEFRIKENGKTFYFFNLHMDHIGKEARKESAKLVLAKIKEICNGKAVILTGDFNVDQTHQSYTLLATSGIISDSYEIAKTRYAENGTFNAFKTERKTESRIDHIFVSQDIQIIRYGVLTDLYWSATPDSKEDIKSGNFPQEVSMHKYTARFPSDHFPVKVVLEFK